VLPTSRCILFHAENISFDDSLVIYTNSTNIPPIMIINRIYEYKSSVAVACFLTGRAKDLSAPITHRGADKSLALPTSRCILFDGEIISFDDSLVKK